MFQNLYVVEYFQYKNDEHFLSVSVVAEDENEAVKKVRDAGIVKTTNIYANNDGYISRVRLVSVNILC